MDTYLSPGDFSKMNPDALVERQQSLEKEGIVVTKFGNFAKKMEQENE